MLTQHLPASNLHKLLSKLGVRTRAADSENLLSVISFESLASPRERQRSFFIGMTAKHPVPAQLVASRVAARPLSSNSFQQHNQAAVPNLQTSQRIFSLSSFQWHLVLFVVALLFAATDDFYRLDSFQLYGLFPSTMLVLMKLSRFTVSVSGQLSLWIFPQTRKGVVPLMFFWKLDP